MSEIVKKMLNHTEFCAREVRGPQIVQTFPWRIKPLTEKFLVLNEHSHIEKNIISKGCVCFK